MYQYFADHWSLYEDEAGAWWGVMEWLARKVRTDVSFAVFVYDVFVVIGVDFVVWVKSITFYALTDDDAVHHVVVDFAAVGNAAGISFDASIFWVSCFLQVMLAISQPCILQPLLVFYYAVVSVAYVLAVAGVVVFLLISVPSLDVLGYQVLGFMPLWLILLLVVKVIMPALPEHINVKTLSPVTTRYAAFHERVMLVLQTWLQF